MSDTITNILLVGVGGQGILLASEILSEAFMLAGFDVKKSEIHGMSQRGGSVVSHVRYGKEVHSPIVPEGEGDILFGFELMETYRYLPLLRKGGPWWPTICAFRRRRCSWGRRATLMICRTGFGRCSLIFS